MLFVTLFTALLTAVAANPVALTGLCTSTQITAVDGRAFRFTGGGGSFRAGTGQGISFDIPTGTALSGVANVYIRDGNNRAYQVLNQDIDGAEFGTADSSASATFVVNGYTTPAGQYTYWANLRLNNGGTCAIGSGNLKFNLIK